uniref:KATNIP domain-containing protein n=1 Tax=Chrysotila carterae TaxID=13221 RepID=A0A7S4F9V3_CHRCT|mmetsp:Transcript_48426/g.104959  ORF Transcript_48426/g.104959 Transcript_48426/m.104959 type:complete len:628 (+) Transcript_48426:123-2006(+)
MSWAPPPRQSTPQRTPMQTPRQPSQSHTGSRRNLAAGGVQDSLETFKQCSLSPATGRAPGALAPSVGSPSLHRSYPGSSHASQKYLGPAAAPACEWAGVAPLSARNRDWRAPPPASLGSLAPPTVTNSTASFSTDPSSCPFSANEPEGILVSLPSGQRFQLDIFTTWGDPYYVGLAALEFFDGNGAPVQFTSAAAQISAEPADINVLPEYSRDPRVVSNLLDGTLATCDDQHLWLAPYTAGQRNVVFVDFDEPTTLSMVRIWNYNKSRIHSFRGARHVEIRMDQTVAFRGEINKAPGNVADAESAAEVVLFTLDDATLARIEQHDAARSNVQAEQMDVLTARPSTANKEGEENALRPSAMQVPMEVRSMRARPTTAALEPVGEAGAFTPTLAPVQDYETALHPKGRVLTLSLTSTWGDLHYIGLNGLELLDPSGTRIGSLARSHVAATPFSVASLPSMQGDPRTPDKLVDGVNATLDDRHMWLTPHNPGATATVSITFPAPITIGVIRLWNYSKTPTRGVKNFALLLDGALIFQGVMRAAPPREQLVSAMGDRPADFVQSVIFTDNQAIIDAEAEHIYNQEELDDEMVIMDNGTVLAGKRANMESARPVTAAQGLGPSRSAKALPRR